jgi:hypothetical protein
LKVKGLDIGALLAITGGGLLQDYHNNLMKAQKIIKQEYKL